MKGPIYELYSSSRQTAAVSLLMNYMHFFLGWVMLPHPQATSTAHGGTRTTEISIERRRRNQFTTAPRIDKIIKIREGRDREANFWSRVLSGLDSGKFVTSSFNIFVIGKGKRLMRWHLNQAN